MKYQKIMNEDEMDNNPEMVELVNLEYNIYQYTYSVAYEIFCNLPDSILKYNNEYKIVALLLQEILILFIHLVNVLAFDIIGHSKRIRILEKLLTFINRYILEYILSKIFGPNEIKEVKKIFFELLCTREIEYSHTITLDPLMEKFRKALSNSIYDYEDDIKDDILDRVTRIIEHSINEFTFILKKMQYNNWLTKSKDDTLFDCPNCGQTLRIPYNERTLEIHCPECDIKFIYPGKNTSRQFLPLSAKRLKQNVSPESIVYAFYLGHYVASFCSWKISKIFKKYPESIIEYFTNSLYSIFINMGIENPNNFITKITAMLYESNQQDKKDENRMENVDILISHYINEKLNNLAYYAYFLGFITNLKILTHVSSYYCRENILLIEEIEKITQNSYALCYLELLEEYLSNKELIKSILTSDYISVDLVYEYSRSFSNIEPKIFQSTLLSIALNEILTDKRINLFLTEHGISKNIVYLLDMIFLPFSPGNLNGLAIQKNGKIFIYIDMNRLLSWAKYFANENEFIETIISNIKRIFVHECLHVVIDNEYKFPQLIPRQELPSIKKVFYNNLATIIHDSIIHPLINRYQREYNLWFLNDNVVVAHPTLIERLRSIGMELNDKQKVFIQNLLNRYNLEDLTPKEAKVLYKKIIKYLELQQYLKVV